MHTTGPSLIVLAFAVLTVDSSHFRGGIVQWRPSNPSSFNGQIEVTHRMAWRRSWSGMYCDATTISSRTLIGGGSLDCRTGCIGTLASLTYYCTDYSVSEDWSSGEKTTIYNMGTVTYFEASFSGCCWISLRAGGSSWNILVKGRLSPRSDNGQINSSPVTATTPIVRVQWGCTRVINIPVQDADGDDIRCRWATGSSECSGVCNAFPYGTLSGCSLTYNGGGFTGLYAVALQIEDFISTSSSTALSSVPLQFIVQLFSSTQPCVSPNRPSLVGETLPDGSCIPVPFGTTFRTSIVAMVGHSSVSIVEFPTVSPIGVQKSAISQSVYNSLLYYTNITWTPQPSQYGLQIFCFSARDTYSSVSDQHCITLLGGVQGPSALQNTTSPTGAIQIPPTGPIQFSIGFDQQISRPTQSSYIRIYKSNGVQLLAFDSSSSSVAFPPSGSQGTVITFTVNYPFQTTAEYYILLDIGVAVGAAFCNQESLSVQDTSFWRFSTEVDECALGIDDCSQFASCTDTYSSFSCTCLSGFTGDGRSCSDINECLLPDGCPPYTMCSNTIGSFTCTCLFGTTSDGVSCAVAPNPNPPASLLVSNIGPTVATVTWTAPSQQTNNAIMSFILILTEAKFNLSSITLTVPASQLSYTFTNLEEFDTYSCIIRSVSEYGFYSADVSVSFNTLAAAPIVAPVNLGGEVISGSLIRLHWTRPPEIHINGPILFYLVEIREVITGRTFTFHAIHDEIIVGPLHPYYEYLCRVAIYTVSQGPFTNDFIVISGEAAPSSPAENVAVNGTTSSSITLSWSPPRDDEQNGVIRYYVVYITPTNGDGGTTQLQANTTVFTIQNLVPFYSPYNISIAAYTVGVGPSSPIVSVTLPESAPSAPPTNLNGYAIDHTSLYFEWEPPQLYQQNGVVVQYLVNVTERETGLMFQRITTQLNITLMSLHPDYVYECSVSAVTVAEGPFSPPFMIRVHVALPSSPPVNVVTISPDPYSIMLSWDPPPSVDRNGPITGYFINMTVVATGEVLYFSTNVSQFSLTSLSPFSIFIFVLAAQNPVGTGPFSVEYTVTTPEDIPDSAPKNFSVQALDSTSIFLSWGAPPQEARNGLILGYLVTVTEVGAENATNISTSTSDTDLLVEDLAPFTTYTCSVLAFTAVGSGPVSQLIDITTIEDAPFGVPTFVTTTNVTSTTITLSWSPLNDDLHNGIIRHYLINIVEMNTGLNYTVQTQTQTIFTIGGLHPFYTYELSVQAVTILPGPSSSSISVATLQDIPAAAPVNIRANSLDSSTLRIEWDAPPLQLHNGLIVDYSVNISEVDTGSSFQLVSGGLTNIVVPGLHPYYTYVFVIAASTIVGRGPYSTSNSIQLPEDAPTSYPLGLTGVVMNSTAILLEWQHPEPSGRNGIITQYDVMLTELPTGQVLEYTRVGSHIDILITSLHPYYEYECSVAACTSVGRGPYSPLINITTDEDAPSGPPINASVVALDSRTVYLTWEPPSPQHVNGIIRMYSIRVESLVTGEISILNTTTEFLTVHNLQSFYTYSFSVAGVTTAVGVYSETLHVTLPPDVPSHSPVNVVTFSPDPYSIMLSWDPPPSVDRNGPITGYFINVTVVATGDVLYFSTNMSQFSLTSLSPFSIFIFVIAAQNPVGTGPFSVQYIVTTPEDIPSPPLNPAVTVPTDPYSLYFSWTEPAVPNGIISVYTVYCEKSNTTVSSEANSMDDLSTEFVSASTNDTSLTLTGLTPYTQYDCFVSAETSAGESDFSVALTAITEEAMPSNAPTVATSETTASTILITWEAPIIPNGVILSYTVSYNLTSENITVVVNASSSTQLTITGLDAYTYYECRITAETKAGSGPVVSVIVLTAESSPDSPPANLAPSVMNSTAASVTWQLPPEEDRNGVIIYYIILLRDIQFNTSDITVNVTELTYQFTDLQEYTRYSVEIAAATSAGLGPFSSYLIFTTHEDTPSAPPQLTSGIARSSTAITLTWSAPPPLEVNGLLRYYIVEVTERHTSRSWTLFSVDDDIHIGSLHPYYYYDCIVAAYTIGAGPFSQTVSIRTDQDIPTAPPEQLSAIVTADSLVLMWSPPPFEQTNGLILYYVLTITELDTGKVYTSISASVVTEISDLHPYYTYHCAIAAYTIALGPYSDANFTVQLKEKEPSGPPTNVTGQPTSSDSIYVSWSPPLFDRQNGLIRSYVLNVTEIETDVTTTHFVYTTSITLYSLHPFYNYEITVSAVTVGAGPYSQVIVVQTNSDVPSSPIQNLTATDISTDTVTLVWRAPAPEGRNGIIIGYRINVTVTTTGFTFVLFSTMENISATSLRPYTSYIIRVAAMTVVGAGPYSSTFRIMTEPAAPEGSPEDVVVSAENSTAIQVSWNPPPAELWNGQITEYRIDILELDTDRELSYTSMTTSILIQFLHPFYTYECSVSAYTVDEGPYSEIINVTTLEDVPSGYPQNFTGLATAPRSAVLTWEPPPEDQQNGIIVEYTVDISVASTGQIFQLHTSATSLTLSTLLPYRTYFFLIRAATVVGQGPPSTTVLQLTTPEDAPSASPNVTSYSAQDSTTVIMSWSPPAADQQNGIIREYRVQVLEIETGNVSFHVSFSTSLAISSLHPDYTYELSVSAFTVATGPYSSVVTVTTPEDVPSGPPQSVNQVSVTSTTIRLRWELPLPEDRNGEIVGYSVRITSLETSEMNVQFVLNKELELTGLRPFITYSLVVAAQTAVGIGPYSRIILVQTLEDAPSHPSNFNGSAINSTHIFLQWDPPPKNATNGIIREYRINVTEILTGARWNYTTDPDTRELVVGSLHPFYTYQCVIVAHTIEPGPFTEAIFIQTEESAPSGAPRNVTISVQNSRSISLSWDPPKLAEQNGILRHYIVTVSSGSTATRMVSSSNTFHTLGGLRPFTNYTCSVQAVTVGSGPSSIVQVATPEDVPTGPPEFIEATTLDPTVLYISWEPPNVEHRNGVIRRYAINITEIQTMSFETFSTTISNFTVTNRHPFYQYHYTIAAETIGLGPFSSGNVIQMPEAAPSAPPPGVYTRNVTSTSFQLLWSEPPPDTHNGIIRSYEIFLTTQNTGNMLNTTTPTTRVELDSLHPFTNYSFQLRAVTVSPGPLTNSQVVSTLEDVPAAAPRDFSVRALSSTSISLSWGALPQEARNGLILGYLVTVTEVGAENATNVSTTTSDTELLVEDLAPFTTYTCSVLAFTAVGSGPVSQLIDITTMEDAPDGAPAFVMATDVTSITITLTWSPPSDDLHNGIIRHYLINILEVNTSAAYTLRTQAHTSLTIGVLHPFYTYELSVQAVTVLPGPASPTITVVTLQDAPAAAPRNIEAFPLNSSTLGIEWDAPPLQLHNGLIVDYSVNISEVDTGNSFQLVSGGLTNIVVPGLHPYYTYVFVIAASTIVGRGPYSTSNSIQLPEDAPTSYPLGLTGVVVNSTAILLEWQHPEPSGRNGIITQYDVMLTELPTGQVLEYTRVGSHIDILITSLHPYYEYECSVAARTSVGRGPYSPLINITTDEDAPSGPPINASVVALDSRTVYLTWEPPSPQHMNGIIRMYSIRVESLVTGEISILNTTTEFLTVRNLQSFYTYSFSVAGVTRAVGVYSETLHVTLPPDVPSHSPVNVVTFSPDPYSIMLSWDPPPSVDRNGPITGYFINVTVVATGDVLYFSTNMSQFSLTSLSPFSIFIFVIAAQNPVGTGPFSVQYIVTTPEDIPSPPLNPAVTVPTDPYSLYFSWTEPAVPNGIISVYTVYCEKSNTTVSSEANSMDDLSTEFVSASTNDTSLTLTGLTPYTQYDCFVSAETSAGESDFSVALTAITEEAMPSNAPTVATSETTASTILITWEAPIIPNGVILSYTVSYNLTSENITVVVNASSSTQLTITGLDAYTYYECRITAETKAGSGPVVSVIILTAESSPDSPPANLAPSVMNSTAASVTWQLPPEEDRNGLIIYYIILLRDIQFNTSDITVNVTELTYQFTDLQEYTRYSVEIAAATSAGLGPFSSSLIFTTHEDTPSAPPQLTSGIARSSTAITLTWSAPPPLEVNGLLRYYIVEVTERHTSRSWTLVSVDDDIHIGSLHPYYYYDCIVAAYTIGAGPFSQTVSIQTDQDIPTAPPEQLSAIVTADSLVLMWSPPPFEQTNGLILYYALTITELDTGKVYTSISASVVTEISDLHPYYTYHCAIAAYTIGLGPYSDANFTVQLKEKEPSGPPTNVTGQPTSSDSIYVSWSPPSFDQQNGLIRSYVLNVTEIETGVTTTYFVYTTSITLYSLHPFYNYEITVSAVTVGAGPYSQVIVVLTNSDVPSSPIQNLTASDISTDTVTLVWRAPAPEGRNGIIIGYRINVTVTITGFTFVLFSTMENISATSLRPHTSYIIRVATVTVVGAGPYSSTFRVMTEPAAPEGSPEDVVVSAESSTAIQVSWNPPPAELWNGQITEYRIDILELDTDRELSYTSMTMSILIQFLHPFYTYECSVSAYTVDEGPYSEIINVTTLEDVPSGYPQNFTGLATAPRSAVLTWEPPPEDQQNGIIVEYTVDISVASTGQTFQLHTSATSLTLSTLLPYRTYFFLIRAATVVGQGPPSTTMLRLTTPEDAPSASPNVSSHSAQDSTTVIMSWSPPAADQQNGIIREYRVQVLEIETGNVSFHVSFSTSLAISSLHPDYTYELSVSAFTVATGPYSSVVTVTTPEDVPSGPPQSVNQVSVTSTTIRLRWELPLPEDRNGKIVGYSVRITSLETSETIVQFVQNKELELTGLRPFITYSLVVAAQTAVGIGPYSKIILVQTLEDAPSHPSNFNGSAINSTHIFLQWDPPPKNATHGIIREYRINVTESLTGARWNYTTDPDTRELVVGSLHPFYTYQCVIVAHTIEPGPFTEAIFIQTEESAPSGAPRNVTIRVQNSRSISLSWDPPKLAEQNGILRHYIVTVSSGSTATRMVSSSNTFHTLGGLRPFTNYTCSVQAVTVGSGPSSIVQVATPEDVPTGPPEFIEPATLDPTVLYISWEPPNIEHRNGVIRRYAINITEIQTMSFETFSTTISNFTVTNRHPFYQYHYTIAAETIGLGPFSSGNVIQMPEAAPSAPPPGVYTRNVTSTSFQLLWSEPPPDTHNGIIRSYEIFLTAQNTGNMLNTTTPTTRVELDSLHPFTNYSFQLRAVTVSPGPLTNSQFVSTLEDVPAVAPQDFSVRALSSTSISLSWGALPQEARNGLILGFLVTVTEIGAENATNISSTTSDTELLVEDLAPFTTYTCSVLAFTSVGNGPVSQLIDITTMEDAPDGAPTFVMATDVTSITITLTWSPPRDDLHNGIIRHYLINILEVNTSAAYTLRTQAHTSLTIGVLHPFYTYELSVQAVTVLPGPASPTITVVTLQDAPAAAPRNIEAFPLNSSTLGIEWDSPPLRLHNGLIVDYSVNISEVETGNSFQVVSGGLTNIVVPGLHPYYTYVFVIAASTIVGRGPYSTSNSIQMPSDAPTSYPLGLTGDVVNSTAILLEWQHPEPSRRNGIITQYDVMLTELPTGQVLEYTRVGSHIDILITSLHPYYEYECSVAARTSVGRGPYSPLINIITDEDAPSGPPINASAVALDSRTVYLTWEPPLPQHANGIIRLYFVRVENLVTGESSLLNTTAEFLTVGNLHPFYNYSLSVAGFTTGVGVYSEELDVTLPSDVPTGEPLNVKAVSVNSTSIRISWEPPRAEEQNGVITSYRITVFETETGAILTFTTAAIDNLLMVNSLHPFYNYTCSVAAFTIGLGPAASVSVQTHPEEPSGAPQNVSVSVLSPTSVNMSWLPPLREYWNGIIIHYIVRVSGVNSEEELELYVVEMSLVIPRLHPFYSYKFSVAAETVAPGPFNDPITIKMPESVPTASPTNVTQVNVTATSVTIGWYPSNPNSWNGLLTHYVIDYQLIRSREESASSSDPALTIIIPSLGQPLVNENDPTRVNSSLLMETANINSLEEFYVYQFSIYYETSVGRSPSSSSLLVKTLPTAPSGPPTMVKAMISSSGSSALVVEWMPPEIRQRNGLITGYVVILTNLESSDQLTYNVDLLNVHVEGLPSYTDFEVTVAALSDSGRGPYSAPVFIKTSESKPSAPRNVTVKFENSTAVSVTWVQPETPNGDINEYEVIYYGFKPEDSKDVDIVDEPNKLRVINFTEPETTVKIGGLKPGLLYEFLVRARTSAGYGANSTAVRAENLSVAKPAASTSIPPGAEAAIVLAILVLLLIVGIAVFYIMYRKFRGKKFYLGISNPRSLNGIPVDVDHMYDNKNVMGTASDFDEMAKMKSESDSLEVEIKLGWESDVLEDDVSM